MASELEREWQRISNFEDKKLKKLERKLESQKPSKLTALKVQLEERIPEKLVSALNAGFEKAFYLIFSKGSIVIDKTFNEEDISLDFMVNDFRMEQRPDRKSLKRLEKGIKKGNRTNTWITFAEGIGLGAIGIGLPDIPLFVGVLLKGIYETCIGYGYDYKEEREQILILRMISAALSSDDKKKKANEEVENWIEQMEAAQVVSGSIEEEIKKTSKSLAEAMLFSKFLQGIFAVGIFGGVVNPLIYQRVLHYASLKYKKRYINEKRRSIKNMK